MVKVSEIFEKLNELAPVDTKLDFDNVGLLVGSWEDEISRVLVALDITMDVIGEAKSIGAELIVSHHPMFFELKSVTDSDTTGARVLALARAGMSAICMHTNLDKALGGVNDALTEALGIEDAEVFGADAVGRVGYVPEQGLRDFMTHVKGALNAGGLRFVDAGRPVNRVAVLGGAGGGELIEAVEAGADTYVTADVKHHQFIDARELGVNLIDAGHFSTENVVVPKLAELLENEFPDLEVAISRAHGQPERFFQGY